MRKKITYRVQKMTESERELLKSVALKLKDRDLFPEKRESALKFIEKLEKQENIDELFNQNN